MVPDLAILMFASDSCQVYASSGGQSENLLKLKDIAIEAFIGDNNLARETKIRVLEILVEGHAHKSSCQCSFSCMCSNSLHGLLHVVQNRCKWRDEKRTKMCELTTLILVNIMSTDLDRKELVSLLFHAARHGSIEFVNQIDQLDPNLIFEVDSKNQSIIHIVAKYRQEKIFMMNKLRSHRTILASKIGPQMNNILHTVAETVPEMALSLESGAISATVWSMLFI
ncbi:uncharacterized protein LOC21401497 [Morus notabilis]|uniref:uncharacterized protein LOC21401497 n=1 Tax=Morus notabilis TaxID=981085 RepID=UPI000CED009D|nr:uncharacterized protein LOC21401497 [Morus notabilis]